MNATEAIRFLRVSSRSQIADITPELCGELAKVLGYMDEALEAARWSGGRWKEAAVAAGMGPDFHDEVYVAVAHAETSVRRTMERLDALTATFELQVTAAVLVEREACAQLVEAVGQWDGAAVRECLRLAASDIRERTHHDTTHNGATIDYGVTNATK